MQTLKLLPTWNGHGEPLYSLTYPTFLVSEKELQSNFYYITLDIHRGMSVSAFKRKENTHMYNSDYLWGQERFLPFAFYFVFLYCSSFYIVNVFLPFFNYLKKSKFGHRDTGTCLPPWAMDCSARIEKY